MLRFRRPAAALATLLTLWPALVFGQAPPAPLEKAGVVTTLEGVATAARVALPQPVPLKFKDDVFLNDRIVTGDRSIARMLLGGKAVVTVRERSTLTITEVPGRSTVALDSGKIALAVARDRLRPGEQIEIRTPNAVAGIRGTVVVAEVLQSTAQVGTAIAAIVTNFYVLRGAITAVNLNPQTGVPLGPPLSVPVGQSFRAVGVQTPSVQPNPPVPQIVSGLQPSAPAHTQAANQEQVTQAQVQTAVTLLQSLLPPTGGGEPSAPTALAPPPPPAETPVEQPSADVITPITNSPVLTPTPTGTTSQLALSGVTGSLGVPPLPDTLQTFSASGSFTANPVVSVTGSSLGQVTAAPMLQVDPGVAVTIPGTLLDVTDSSLMPALHLARVQGTLTQSGGGTLISLDPSSVMTPAGTDLFHVASSGVVTLAGQLLADVGGLFDIGRSFVFLGAPAEGPGTAALTSTTTAPLIEFSGSQVKTADSFMRIGSGGSVRTGGTLVKATDSTGDIGGGAAPGIVVQGPGADGGTTPNLRAGALLELVGTDLDLGTNPLGAASNRAVITIGTPTGAVVRIVGGSLAAGALLSGDGTGNAMILAGTVLELSGGASANLGSFVTTAGGTDTIGGSLGSGVPFVRVTDSNLTLTGPGAHVLLGNTGSAQQGVALISSRTTTGSNLLNLTGVFLGLDGANLTDPGAQIQLSDTTLTQSGGSFIEVTGGGTTQVAGSLVSVRGGSVTAGGDLLRIGDGALAAASSPLLRFDSTSVTAGIDLVSVFGAPPAPGGATLSLPGTLVRATSSAIQTRGLGGGAGGGGSGLPAIWEPNIGPQIILCDDCTTNVSLGFSFPFQRGTYTGAEVSSNGFISLGGLNGHGCCNGDVPSFLSGAARIAAAWYDLITGNGVHFNSFGNRAVVTWDHNQEYCCFGDNTLQMQLLADGRIIFGYAAVASVNHTALVGVTPGGGVADPGPVDFSHGLPFNSGTTGTVYQLFGPGTFDLSGLNLVFTPNGDGWDVTALAAGAFLAVGNGAVVTQTQDAPLVDLTQTTLIAGGGFLNVSGGAQVALAGSLLDATDSPMTFSDHVFQVASDASLASTSLRPLVTLLRSPIGGVEGAPVPGSLFDLHGTVTLAGSLFAAADSALAVRDTVLAVDGTLVTTAPAPPRTYPLVSITGGAVTVGGGAADSAAVIEVRGFTTAAVVVDPDVPTLTALADQRPLQHNGGAALVALDGGASVDVQGTNAGGLRVDKALLEATAPIFDLVNGSTLQTNGDAIALINQARVEHASTMIRLDNASVLRVLTGHLVNVSGGSRLTATNLLSVSGGSTVTISNGLLLNVTGNSLASFSGCLVCFGTGGGTVSITNAIAPTGTLFGQPVAVYGVLVPPSTSPFTGSGTITVSPGGSLLRVDAGSKLRLGSL